MASCFLHLFLDVTTSGSVSRQTITGKWLNSKPKLIGTMKDQNTLPDGESKKDKWNRGLDIFIESVIEPDPALRACAHNQKCYHELMDVRQDVLNYLKTLRWH